MDTSSLKQSKTNTLVALFVSSLIISTMGEIYYVKPNSSTPCPEDGEHQCLTISQYAIKPSNYSASNVSLMFLSGNHSLDVDLNFTKRTYLEISTQTTRNGSEMNPSTSDVSITCSQAARVVLQEIDHVEIKGINFLDCAGNHITSVDKLTIDGCNFDGRRGQGTALVLSEIMLGKIIGSSYNWYSGIKISDDSTTIGGAMFISNDSNISIHECWFVGNKDSAGGVIHSEGSLLGVYDSIFLNNGISTTVSANGSVITATFSTVIVHNSSFIGNYIEDTYFVYGGVMYTYYCNVTVTNSTFLDNSVTCYTIGYSVALYTELCEATVSHSTFNNNSLHSGRYSLGGAVYSTLSSVQLDDNTFIDNYMFAYSNKALGGAVCSVNDVTMIIDQSQFRNNAIDGDIAFGGAVFGSNSVMNTLNGVFIGNSVLSINSGYGGAVFCEIGTLNVNNCDFLNNTVSGSAGYGGAVSSYDSTVEVNDSRFVGNSAEKQSGGNSYGGALNALSTNISITNCNFDLNSVYSPFLCEGGAVNSDGSQMTILDSTFDRNSIILDTPDSNAYGGAIQATETILVVENCIFSSNLVAGGSTVGGGAVYIFSGSLNLKETSFIGNNATSTLGYGGALYAFSTNVTSQSFIDVYNNTADLSVMYIVQSTVFLTGNTTFKHNSGSLFAFSSNVTLDGLTSMLYNRKTYTSSTNAIQDGGAITSFQSRIIFTGSTYLAFNSANMGGAILATESMLISYGDITIENNEALKFGGGVYIYQTSFQFSGRKSSYITMNRSGMRGGGINAVGSIILLNNGSLYITENSAERGGGVSLDLNARICIVKSQPECVTTSQCFSRAESDPNSWLRLEFTSNHADYGGALYVSDATNSANCAASQTTESECFIQTFAQHPYLRPNLNLLNIYFTNNTARVTGQTLYGGLLDRCTVSIFSEIFNKYYDVSLGSISAISYLLNITNINFTEEITELTKRQVSSEPVRVCFCNDNKPDCSYKPPDKLVKIGQMFKVPLVAVDQTNNTVIAKIDSSLSQHTGGLGEGQTTQETSNHCTELNFTVFSSSTLDTEQILLNTRGPCRDIGISQNHMNLNFLPCDYCPIGFLATPNCDCLCDPILFPTYVSNCSIDNESVMRRENVWISYENDSGYVTFPHCPFDYCLSSATLVNLNDPNGSDEQCNFNRSGKLCGSCREDLSLNLGSSRCTSCSNNWLLLLILFSLAGIALVAFLLAFNLTVAVGTINGLVFYANIIEANRAIFLPYGSNNILTVFIAWLNLDFGFETCFVAGLDGYIKTWLQLVFPVYVIFSVVIVITLSQYSQKFAQLLSNRNPVATLATLILLSYAKLIRTIVAALSFGKLEYSDSDTTEVVWLVDANVKYFKGKHIPLFITAFIILIIGLMYSHLLFCWQWLLHCPQRRGLRWIRHTKFNSFMDAYCAPYAAKHRYWTGLLLLVRALLYVIFAFNVMGDPGVNLLSIICVAGCVLAIMALTKDKVYKNWALFALETSFFFNVIIFSAVTLYVRQTNEYANIKTVPATVSVTIALTTFLAILIYHTCAYFATKQMVTLKTKLIKLRIAIIQSKLNRKKTETDLTINEENAAERLSQFYELREPLNLVTSVSNLQDKEDEKATSKHLGSGVVTHTVINGIPT